MKLPEALKLTPRPRPADGSPVCLESLARELNENLGVLYEALKQLAELAGVKLGAMRRADDRALEECAAQEDRLLEEVFAAERNRKATLARLAQALQSPQLERAALSEIAGRLGEPWTSILRARNVALREVARKLQQKNQVAARVAHNLQSHIRAIFAELAKASQESGVYGPKGQREPAGVRTCLDAVG